jgi:NAD(P)-dependent dehydrogenase (short-subunit alcohol dehydrogenase family)
MPRTILITGANGNLGVDVVDYLSKEDHKIITVTGSKPMPENLNDSIIYQQSINLMNESDTLNALQQIVNRFPETDAAILLAGGFEMGNIQNTNETQLDKLIALNFKTAWFVIQPLIAHFKNKGGGQFILMGAKPALIPSESVSKVAYGLSKSLLFTLAEIINTEGKDTGIAASVIVPEVIDTLQNRKDMPDADFNRWVKTSTISEIISFILSDAGRWLRQPVYKAYNRNK